jgi:hypothetical protein
MGAMRRRWQMLFPFLGAGLIFGGLQGDPWWIAPGIACLLVSLVGYWTLRE